MRRFVVSGLVPCPPATLADRLLDFATAGSIWAGASDVHVLREGHGWWECARPEGGGAVTVRFRRVSPVEVVESPASAGQPAVLHRFLPAEGGCLWTLESRAEPGEHEPWSRFARRRRRDRDRAERWIDEAAAYFAAII